MPQATTIKTTRKEIKHRRRLREESIREGTEYRPMSRERATEAERMYRGFTAMGTGDYEGIGQD